MKLFYEKYIKLAHIGKGANAHVYKVKHAELGYVRAIKILNEDIESKGERAYQSFLKECKTLLAIGNGAHPNIIRIYGPDLIDNHAIVEMDYVQGTTLDSYIKQKVFLDYDEVKTLIHDIVGALAYTHHDIYKFMMNPEEDDLQQDTNDGQKYIITSEKEAELVRKYGIAHNDLHSNNVMRRDYDGSFVLLDFGLAVQDGECIKSSRKSDGHPEYMAPEKFDSGEITPRSDVYSLGVLIYEALTGRPPFVLDYDADGKVSYPSLSKICNEHHSKTPIPILPLRKEAFERQIPGSVYERDYPEWLDTVVMKCLAKNPEDRYSDAKELLDDINQHLSREKKKYKQRSSSIGVSDNKDKGISGSETVEPKQRNKRKKLLFIVVGCLILIGIVMYFFQLLKNNNNDYIPTTGINIPASEYLLNIGDSLVIIPKVIPVNASDTVVTWTSSNPEIAVVRGNTIIALNSGDVILTASANEGKIAVNVSVKVSDPNAIDTNDYPKHYHSEEQIPKNEPVLAKSKQDEGAFTTKPQSNLHIQPITKNKSNSQSSKSSTPIYNSVNMGYGTWHGPTKNGKPHGKGKVIFSTTHKVDRRSDIVANSGDYFEAVYENGQLISGTLFDGSGNKKNTVIP